MTHSNLSGRAIPVPPDQKEALLRARIRVFCRYLEPKFLNGPMGMLETVRTAKDLGLVLVPYADFNNCWKVAGNGGTKVRTGTLVIHEADGRALGDTVVSGGTFYSPETFVFEVPAQFRGKTGWLIAESPDFDFEQKRGAYKVVIPEGRLIHVERAATHAGCFRQDRETGAPIGDRLTEVDSKKLGTVSVYNKHEACIDLMAKELSGKTIYLDIATTDPLRALVRLSITPQNYVERVIAAISAASAVNGMRAFLAEWAKEDPTLAQGMHEAGIAGF